jgi:uncharacterized protein YciI
MVTATAPSVRFGNRTRIERCRLPAVARTDGLKCSNVLTEKGMSMYFLVTGTLTNPDRIGPDQQEEETRVLSQLREQGLVREAFRKASGPGVVSILQAPTLEEAQAQMGRLPFVADGLLTFEYTELIEL